MKYRIGIALSGGAARGIAHIGVLQALEENNLQPEIISGCSAGAIIGVLYADGKIPLDIYKLVEHKNLYSIVRMRLPDKGVMELGYFQNVLTKELKHNRFDALKKEFYLSVTNLNTGTWEVVHTGDNLIQYVIASSSIPMIFKPVKIDAHYYVDGGVLHNLPAACIRGKCEVLIGVNVNPVSQISHIHGIKDVGMRCVDLSLNANVQSQLQLCDVVIEPEISAFGLFDLTKSAAIYQAGYDAALRVITSIRKKLST